MESKSSEDKPNFHPLHSQVIIWYHFAMQPFGFRIWYLLVIPLEMERLKGVRSLNRYINTDYQSFWLVFSRTLANYMMWRLVDALYLRLGDKFEEIFKNFYIRLDNYWSSTPREELCVQLMTEKYFETPLSRIYVEKFFDGESKKSVRKGTPFYPVPLV